MNKSSARTRLVIWSCVAVVCTGLLATGLAFADRISASLSIFGDGFSYEDSDSYRVGGASLPIDDIRQIEVGWVSGGVNLQPYDGAELLIEERSDRTLNERERMRYQVRDGRLTIQFCAPMRAKFLRGFRAKKELTVKVPRALAESLEEIEINSISSRVEASGMKTSALEVSQISGETALTDIQCDDFAFEAVSGRLTSQALVTDRAELTQVSGKSRFDGEARQIEYEGISGDASIRLTRLPERVEGSTVSGNVTLSLPENDGFTARYDKVSGRVSCDFPAAVEKNQIVYKDGTAARFSFETVSGDIHIEQN